MPSLPPLTLPCRPRRVFVCTGHRIDALDRPMARFPSHLETAAARRIDELLASLAVDKHDLALTQGAAGADLLFAQACLHRGAFVQLMLPLPEEEFIARSILPSPQGEQWRQRFVRARSHPAARMAELPSTPGDPFERCNAWMCATAAASGAQELHLLCLWNGQPDDGPGGTAHMVSEMQSLGGQVHWIDTRTLT